MEMILSHVDFSYGKLPVLRDINLRIDKPGLYCVVGPNGVGKSTLIKCMNKLLSPTSGDVFIDGRNLKEISLKELSKSVAYVPVKTEDLFSMPVIDSIMIGRYSRQKWKTSKEDLRIVHQVMKMMGIEIWPCAVSMNCLQVSIRR
ncbi:hypothetical protein AUQ37_04145 [Candidatus Methanomethylophilus sp. 1R26]|uniref:ATP-binding cassette domain-containing protein n=1 Tax=Candidatus Methanomethylophilus sp. 1R26 TaxID=1769296 RepID=UPI0007361441|nr:ABC transporter ATP-binding protein [Candidatus Methanomethylophilus sp. 1R26]KUE73058.1 hypothetical protein AUQ37_04145 [Candidatus Methanomethylophilus sp. 1R26]